MTHPDSTFSKNQIFKQAVESITSSMRIRYVDDSRPWGGFLVINEEDNNIFIDRFFPHLSSKLAGTNSKLSPKILLVAPNSRLSWQYHHRRAEIWKVIDGVVEVITSNNDEEKDRRRLKEGDINELLLVGSKASS